MDLNKTKSKLEQFLKDIGRLIGLGYDEEEDIEDYICGKPSRIKNDIYNECKSIANDIAEIFHQTHVRYHDEENKNSVKFSFSEDKWIYHIKYQYFYDSEKYFFCL